MQVSPYKTKPKVQQPSAFDMALGFAQVAELNKELQALKEQYSQSLQKHKAILDNHIYNFETIIQSKMEELGVVLQQVLAIQKGDQGEPGESPEPLDEDVVIEKVLSKIVVPVPSNGVDGQDAFVDEDSIIKRVLSKIPKSEAVKVKPIDHQAIVDKVFEILDSGEKKLSLKHIGDFTTGLEQTIAPIRSLAAGFRGGGDVVKAGSNVTITTDADGKKVITSSGGSGFTALAATETPNGILTVFTFSLASAQPSYLVVDNVWMKATTAAGTVNWTWNAGSKKATLTVPAQDDIWAVV